MEDLKKTTEKPVPTIELGGRFWFLKVTHRVMERFSAISKCRLADFDVVIERYDMMVLLLWLMMCESRADLTREGLTGWLNAMTPGEAIQMVSDAVAAAVGYSFPEPADDEEGDEAVETKEAGPRDPTAADI